MKYILITGSIKFFVLSADTDFVRLSVRIHIYGMLFLSVGRNSLYIFDMYLSNIFSIQKNLLEMV